MRQNRQEQHLSRQLHDLSSRQEEIAMKLMKASDELSNTGLIMLATEVYRCADELKTLADEIKPGLTTRQKNPVPE